MRARDVDAAMFLSDLLTPPNLLTLLRLLLTPGLAWLVATGRLEPAAWLFAVVAVTDALDGWLARRLGQVSALGEKLDPLADKALVNACGLAAASLGLLPWWLAWLVLGRDGIILAGAALTHRLRLGHSLLPRRIGKLSTALQMLLIALLLGAHGLAVSLPPLLPAVLVPVVAAVTAGSGLVYAFAWLRDLPAGVTPAR